MRSKNAHKPCTVTCNYSNWSLDVHAQSEHLSMDIVKILWRQKALKFVYYQTPLIQIIMIYRRLTNQAKEKKKHLVYYQNTLILHYYDSQNINK